MSLQERLYHKLPVFLQHVACSWVGLQLRRARINRKIVDDTIRDGNLNHSQLCAIRDTKLRAFVQHCATTVPYYRRWFQDQNIDYRDIQSLDDLKSLPIINRAIVKENLKDFYSDAIPQRQYKMAHTGGTTGSGLIFPTTAEALQRQWATWWRYRHWHGIGLDTWCAHFTGGRPIVEGNRTSGPFWRYNWPMKQTIFSTNHMSEQTISAYISEIRRSKPVWIHGQTSSVAHLASYIVSKDIDLGYQVELVSVGAENLLSQQRSLIEKAFGISVIMHYGLAEAVANISERPNGRYYVDEDFAAVEFVQLENRAGHRIIGTNFSNPAFPLLRYDTGDVASLPCDSDATIDDCYPGRIVSSIDGRLQDYVVLSDRTHVNYLDNIFLEIVNIREAQVHQERPGEVTLSIVRSENYNKEDEEKILGESRRLFGDRLAIDFKYVEKIRKSDAGKLKFIVSSCNEMPGLVS